MWRNIYRCLHSIAEQTYPLIEIIAVDDQSRDNSVAEMERAQQELFKFNSLGGGKTLLIKQMQSNVGAGKVRDYALTLASGCYIMFVDGDDWIHPQAVEWSVNMMEKYNAQLVQFGWQKALKYVQSNDRSEMPLPDIVTGSAEIEKKAEHICCGKLYLADVIRKLDLKFNYRIFEDTAFTRRYALHCSQAVFTDYPYYFYYYNPHSVTSSLSPEKLQESIYRADEVAAIYREHGLAERADEYLRVSKKFFLLHLCMVKEKSTAIEISSSSELGKMLQKAVGFIIREESCH